MPFDPLWWCPAALSPPACPAASASLCPFKALRLLFTWAWGGAQLGERQQLWRKISFPLQGAGPPNTAWPPLISVQLESPQVPAAGPPPSQSGTYWRMAQIPENCSVRWPWWRCGAEILPQLNCGKAAAREGSRAPTAAKGAGTAHVSLDG